MAGVPDWTVSAMDAGAQVDILPADIYFKSMAQAILASDETIAKNPQLIQKLVRATLKGMKDIMADPKAATAVYVNHVPVHKGKEASIQKAFELFNKYVYAAQKVPGTMDEARLAAGESAEEGAGRRSHSCRINSNKARAALEDGSPARRMIQSGRPSTISDDNPDLK
mgnify:CR=1 FL=1